MDVRTVAATNQDLAEMVSDRQFRADLYYRLNVFPIQLPALRERAEDIPALVRHFVSHFAAAMNKYIDEIPSHVIDALSRHHWPGNIRELQNFIERHSQDDASGQAQGNGVNLPQEHQVHVETMASDRVWTRQ